MIRILKNSFIFVIYAFNSLLSCFFSFFIFFYIFIKGKNSLSLEFILKAPKGTPLGKEGGICPAIIGSLEVTALACFFASILALSTAIYIFFYCKNERIKNFFNTIIASIAGIPSIVLGLFGYSFLVYFCKFGISLFSGAITLSIMIFPYIEVACLKSFEEIDLRILTASYSLGTNKLYTFIKIVLPLCAGEILSSIVLSGGFAIGAAAPLMFTAAAISAPVPNSLFSPIMALPNHLYILLSQGISTENAYGTAFILLVILILINLISTTLVKAYKI